MIVIYTLQRLAAAAAAAEIEAAVEESEQSSSLAADEEVEMLHRSPGVTRRAHNRTQGSAAQSSTANTNQHSHHNVTTRVVSPATKTAAKSPTVCFRARVPYIHMYIRLEKTGQSQQCVSSHMLHT